MSYRRMSQRGDTIIEVLLAMSVIGLVLGAAFGIANRSVAIGQDAQERTEALKVAESQLEQLRALSTLTTNPLVALPAGSSFCFRNDNAQYLEFPSPLTEDELNDAQNYPAECNHGVNGRYSMSVTKSADYLFTIRARWDPLGGGPLKELTTGYRVYPAGSNAFSAVPLVVAPPTPPPTPVPLSIGSITISGNVTTASMTGSILGVATTRQLLLTRDSTGVVTTIPLSSNNLSRTIDSLIPGQTYRYTLIVRNSGTGEEVSSAEQTFATTAPTIPNSTYLGIGPNGSSYYFVDELVTWTQAKANAEALGGHLVTFESPAENSYVSTKFSQTAWIGLTDQNREGEWLWETGEPYNYTNWNPGQPDNWLGAQNYALMNWPTASNGRWDDQGASDTNRYVIEYSTAAPGSLPAGVTEIANPPNNNRYYLSSSPVSCDQAYSAAIGSGGHLVTISSTQENSFISNSVAAGNRIWLGLNDKDTEGVWRWVTGESVNYTNWYDDSTTPGVEEPNDYNLGNPGEDCAAMNWVGAGTWNDWFRNGVFDSNAYYIIEIEGN